MCHEVVNYGKGHKSRDAFFFAIWKSKYRGLY